MVLPVALADQAIVADRSWIAIEDADLVRHRDAWLARVPNRISVSYMARLYSMPLPLRN
jgi:hypothetical protein